MDETVRQKRASGYRGFSRRGVWAALGAFALAACASLRALQGEPVEARRPVPPDTSGLPAPSGEIPPENLGVLHIDPRDPRRFTLNGEPWYLAGYYPNIAALTADQTDYESYYRTFIDLLAENRINYFRNVFNMGQPYGEAMVVYQRTGPGLAADGRPKLDLTFFNQDYFDYWRKVIEYAGSKGIIVQLVIFDSWHNKRPVVWTNEDELEWGMIYDFYNGANNINGINAASRRDWHNPNHPVFLHQKALIREVVDQLGDLPNIVYEISNENYYNEDWELQLADYLTEYEAAQGFARHLVMPRDLPNHDQAGGKGNEPETVYREIAANYSLHRPLIADNDGGGSVDPAGRRKKAWITLTAGGHISYFHGGMYREDVLTSEDARLGMKYIGLTRKFLEDYQVDLAGMQPCEDLVSAAYCLGLPGEAYIIYLEQGGPVQVSDLPPAFWAVWFNPRDGSSHAAEGSSQFTAPDREDWVLYIEAGRNSPEEG